MNNNKSRRQFLKLSAIGAAVGASQASAMSVLRPQISHRNVKALVIGSGFGGAVSGLRLAEAGVQTLMLERGQWWKPDPRPLHNIFSANIPADHRSSWFKNIASPPVRIDTPIIKYAGVLDYADFDGLRMYQGAAVGGGSIVYGGVTVRSPSHVLQSIFAGVVDTDEFESKYYPLAEAMIGASEIPDDIYQSDYYRYARIFTDHAHKAGYETRKTSCAYDFDIIRQELNGEIKKSALIGETIYGNNNGCKKTLVQSYLQPALDTGNLEISPLTEVERISMNDDGTYRVQAKIISPWGWVQSYLTIDCEHLFLGAGTVGTNKLLLKAKSTGDLPNLNEYVGSNIGNNGGVTWARTIPEATGPNQAAPLNVTLEDFNNPYGPLSIECAYFPTGIDTHSLVQLGVFFDETNPGPGTFSYSEDKGLSLSWPSDANDKSIAAHRHAVDHLNEVNGGFSGVPILISEPSGSRTAHPLGGAPLGLATDAYGRLHGYNNLYVMDGTLIPGSCLANPSLTITALAERNIEAILKTNLTQYS